MRLVHVRGFAVGAGIISPPPPQLEIGIVWQSVYSTVDGKLPVLV